MDAQKCECRSGERQSAKQKTHRTDFTTFRQHEATTIAQLALRGHTVTRGTNDDFFVGKWGLIRHCPDYASLVSFALMVGASS